MMIRPEPFTRLEATGLGPDVHHGDVRVVVDEDRRFGEAADGVGDLLPVRLVEAAGAQLRGVDPRLGRQQALRDFVAAHFQTEQQRRHVGLHRRVGEDAEGEARLTHGGTGADHDQVVRLQAGEAFVEVV